MSLLSISNGTIRTESGEHVMCALPKTTEVCYDDWNFVTAEKPITAYYSYEVTLIRVFCHDGCWHTATTRKIDAFSSRWGGQQSFGQIFADTIESITGEDLETFYRTLNQDTRYFFTIPTRDSGRIGTMVDPVKPVLFLVAHEEKGTGKVNLSCGEMENASNIWTLLPQLKLTQKANVKRIMDEYEADSPMTPTGIMICESDKFTRVVHPEYWRIYKLRANEPNVTFRYMDLLRSDMASDEDRALFIKQHAAVLEYICGKIFDIITFLHSTYLARYVHRECRVIHPIGHRILVKCHDLYRETREQTTRLTVANMLFNSTDNRALLALLKDGGTLRDELPPQSEWRKVQNVTAPPNSPRILRRAENPVRAKQPQSVCAPIEATSRQEILQELGEKLYPLVQNIDRYRAGKITGMLLELKKDKILELLELLDDTHALEAAVEMAVGVLKP